MIATLIGQPALRARLVSSISAVATPCDVGGEYGKKTSWPSRMSLAGSPSARAGPAGTTASTTADKQQARRRRMAHIIATGGRRRPGQASQRSGAGWRHAAEAA